jgi:hypothetical protein
MNKDHNNYYYWLSNTVQYRVNPAGNVTMKVGHDVWEPSIAHTITSWSDEGITREWKKWKKTLKLKKYNEQRS